MTAPLTNADVSALLLANDPDPEFRTLTERFEPQCWARHDLSAVHLGYTLGRDSIRFLAAIEEARRVWLEEFPTEPGTDAVTPFDQFLYKPLGTPND